MNTSELAVLQQYAVEERDKKKAWFDIAKTLLNRNGMSPADVAEVILPLVDDQGSASSVLWAVVLSPDPSADFVAVRRVFEAHGVDLLDAITKKNLEEKLQAKGQELQTLQQQLNSPSLDPEKKETLAKQYRDVEFEAKKMQEDSQAEYQRVERKVGEAITKLAAPIVDQLAKEQKLQMVFSDQALNVLSWGDKPWMEGFTAEVAKRLDASEAPAGTPAKPSTPKPAAKAAPKK